MPKVKTHSGAKKRFNITGGGKVKRASAFISHKLTTSKSRKQKNSLHAPTYVSKTDYTAVKKLLNF